MVLIRDAQSAGAAVHSGRGRPLAAPGSDGNDCHQEHERDQEIANLRAQVAALTGSRGFKLLQALYAVRLFLMPCGSRRERWGDAVFRLLGRMTRRSRRPPNAGSEHEAASPADARSVGPSPSQSPEPAVCDDLLYSPLDWQLRPAASGDDQFLNLVILAATHRAGSTLLQRICNARPGTLIWGEHGGLLSQFADIYAKVVGFSATAGDQRDAYFSRAEDPNLWIANMSPELSYARQAIVDAARTLLRTFYAQHREDHDLVGFKEVRYGQAEIELLRRCYPQAEILLLVRNPLNTWKSMPRSWCATAELLAAKWDKNVRCFQAFAKTDSRCHLLRHEDVVRQTAATVATLGDVAKLSREQIAAVLAHKIGSTNAGISESDRSTIIALCRESMDALGYL
jgi:hypothetical protein